MEDAGLVGHFESFKESDHIVHCLLHSDGIVLLEIRGQVAVRIERRDVKRRVSGVVHRG